MLSKMNLDSWGKLVALAIPLGIGISFLILGLDVVLAKTVEYLFHTGPELAEFLFICVAILESLGIVWMGFSFLQAQTVGYKDIITLKELSAVEYHRRPLLALSLIIAGVSSGSSS